MNSFTNVANIVKNVNQAWLTVLKASGFITPQDEEVILLAVEKEVSREKTP